MDAFFEERSRRTAQAILVVVAGALLGIGALLLGVGAWELALVMMFLGVGVVTFSLPFTKQMPTPHQMRELGSAILAILGMLFFSMATSAFWSVTDQGLGLGALGGTLVATALALQFWEVAAHHAHR